MEPAFTTVYVKEISDHFQYIKRLSKGTFGKVLLVQEKATGNPVAMKAVKKDKTELNTFQKELSYSIFLSNHPGIIATHPIFIDTPNYYIMIQELATARTLQQLIDHEEGIPEITVKRCAAQLARALDYMHSRRLVHRDLKAENILLMDKECHSVKLCDFGQSRPIGSIVTSVSNIIPSLSPEQCVMKSDEYMVVTTSIDSWAFAVLLYVALMGDYPWEGAVEEDEMYQAFHCWQKSGNNISPPAQWKKLTYEALNMFNKLLSEDPDSRYSVLSITHCIRYAWRIEEFSEEEMTEEEEEDEDMEESILQAQEST
ncbi:serine/threonine-protein kinase SBK1-like [Lithobates pipiens]